MPSPSTEPGRVRPVSAVALAVAALLGALGGGLVPPLVERSGGIVPTVSWAAVLALVFLAVVLLALAATTWRTVQRQPQRLEPHRAVNLLVLGKASALAGALIAGGYLAFALTFAGETDAVLPRERFVRGLLAAGAGAALAVGGLLLERACRVPGAGDDESEDVEA